MELKFDLTLRRLCIVAVADSLWNQKDIINRMKTYFLTPKELCNIEPWKLIIENVIKQINRDSLPSEFLYSELVYATHSLGMKRREWLRYLKWNFFKALPNDQFYELYGKKIYWTHYGTVDEEKTIKHWLENENVDLWTVYIVACNYCSEEMIKDLWARVSKAHQPCDFKKLCKNYNSHLGVYWDRRFRNSLENFISDLLLWFTNLSPFYLYDENESTEVNMFQLSICMGFKQAAKIFWFQLNETEKVENFLFIFQFDWHLRTYGDVITPADYIREQNAENFLFLFNQINGDTNKMKQLFEDGHQVNDIFTLMLEWPWVQLITVFVEISKNYLGEEEFVTLFDCVEEAGFYRKKVCLFRFTSEAVTHFVNFKLDCKDTIFRRKFHQLWRILPLDYKEEISMNIIPSLFYNLDVEYLKWILNDTDLVKIRNELITQYYSLFDWRNDDGQEWNKQFANLMVPINVDKSIQSNLEILYQHIFKGEFELADEFLNNLHFSSSEEKNHIKNVMDARIACYYFIKTNQLDLAEKFLNWKFNSKKSVIDYKNSLSSKEYSSKHIFDIWMVNAENIEEAKVLSSNFLNWLFNSNTALIDNFIKVKIMDSEEITFYFSDHLDVMQNFLSWLVLNEEQINFVKDKFLNREPLYFHLERYLIHNNFEPIQKFLNWVFNSDEERDSAIKNFFESGIEKGSKGCILFMHTQKSKMIEPQPVKELCKEFKKFINFWMKPVKNFRRLIENLKTDMAYFKLTDQGEDEKLPVSGKIIEESLENVNLSAFSTLSVSGKIIEESLENVHLSALSMSECLKLFISLLKSFKINGNEFLNENEL